MTVERLEELIKQGGTVYVGDAIYLKLTTEYSSIKVGKSENIYYLVYRDMWFPLNRVYENKEQLEWAKKTHAERIERFEPPMWEEIDKKYQFKFMWKDLIIRFAVLKFVNTIKIEDDDDECQETYFDEPATKKNYEKACKVVRDLFKGVEK